MYRENNSSNHYAEEIKAQTIESIVRFFKLPHHVTFSNKNIKRLVGYMLDNDVQQMFKVNNIPVTTATRKYGDVSEEVIIFLPKHLDRVIALQNYQFVKHSKFIEIDVNTCTASNKIVYRDVYLTTTDGVMYRMSNKFIGEAIKKFKI